MSKITNKDRENILEFIFDEMSINNLSLRKSCERAKEKFKLKQLTHTTALEWIDKLDKNDHYTRAREQRSDNIFEEIMDIADDGRNDTYTNEDGVEVVNHDHIQRSRLRIEARKWMLGKMQPKKYGDKVDVTSDGEKIEGGVTIFQIPDNGRD